jgi:hypothetical protein
MKPCSGGWQELWRSAAACCCYHTYNAFWWLRLTYLSSVCVNACRLLSRTCSAAAPRSCRPVALLQQVSSRCGEPQPSQAPPRCSRSQACCQLDLPRPITAASTPAHLHVPIKVCSALACMASSALAQVSREHAPPDQPASPALGVRKAGLLQLDRQPSPPAQSLRIS